MVAGNRCRVHFAVNLLGHSRHFHVWVAPCEDAEHTYESLMRAFESLAHLNQQLEQWLVEVAGPRIHGTLKVRVADRFAEERLTLQPLPPVRFSTDYRESRQVALDAFIDVDGNRYGVPAHLCGERVAIQRSPMAA